MPVELHRLKMQLAQLRIVLEDAVIARKPLDEKAKIRKQIVEVEHLIEKRIEILRKQD